MMPPSTCERLSPTQRAFLESLLSPTRLARLQYVLKSRLACITLVLDNLLDPHNMAAIVRTVEAMGCQDLHVIEENHTFDLSRNVTKHSHKWITIHRYPDAQSCIRHLRESHFQIYSAMLEPAAVSLYDVPVMAAPPPPFGVGNEQPGIRKSPPRLTAGTFFIPMQGFTESFNVSVAAALVLSHATRERRRNLPEGAGSLTQDRLNVIYDNWLRKSVKNSGRLLRSVD